jgi:hypothetical protein
VIVAKEAFDLSGESLCYSCGSSYLGKTETRSDLTDAVTNLPGEQHRMDGEYSCRGERERDT